MMGTLVSNANADCLELGGRLPQHATNSGDRPISPRSGTAPPPQMRKPTCGPIVSRHSDDDAGLGRQDQRPQPQPQPHAHPHPQAHSPVFTSFATRPTYTQQELQSFFHPPGTCIDPEWPPLESSPLGGTDTSGSSSSNLFEYNAQTAAATAATAVDGPAYREYVSPTSLHNNGQQATGFSFGMPWSDDYTGAARKMEPLANMTSTALASPTIPGEALFMGTNPWLDSIGDDGENEHISPPAAMAGVADMGSSARPGASKRIRQQREKDTAAQAQAQAKVVRRSSKDARATSPTAYSHNRRISFDSNISALTPTPSGKSDTSSSGRTSKLRSASRSSKNTHHKPAETLEERRSRTSHNLVEKQYRNRLNAQFESLLNALPEQVRGGADCDESDPPAEYTDKRVSKAEVLDMARRHIRSLERERNALEVERDELRGSLDLMQERYGRVGLQPDEEDNGVEGATAEMGRLSEEDKRTW